MASDIVGSNAPTFASDALKPSKRGYGQNGYRGASSDTPGQRTTSGFLPDCTLASAVNSQMRTVSAKPFPPANAGARDCSK